MTQHAIQRLIEQADAAINQEDFDALIEFYTEDALLVVKPGTNARGKGEIRRAFELIAAHFNHRLEVRQAGMTILESGDTALVLAMTIVAAPGVESVTRAATYVFRKDPDGNWRCAIDNSYGHELLAAAEPDA
jgi:uncharacterized protein (TIGR02246 family)